ncbi:MAG: efflux RND transporter periplasmic adaptor subunit [Verrucomicrobiota bacterium]
MNPSVLWIPCFAALLLGCSRKKAELPPPPLRPVITHTVQPGKSETIRRFSGQVDSAEGTGIGFEVGGRVIDVLAKAGRTYEANMPLATLDDTDYRNQLSDAQAQLTNAEQELRRMQRLYESRIASQSQLEAATAQQKSARANRERAQKSVDDCVLKMPYTGVIGRVDVEPQQIVSPGQSMVTIQGEAGLEFDMGVPAEDIAQLKNGMTATVTLGVFPGRTLPAVISEISPEVADNTTYPVTLTLTKESFEQSIRPGLDGEAALSLPNPLGTILKVPSASVATNPEGKNFVWIVETGENKTGKVIRRIVQPKGLAPGNMIEITEGLNPGDVVVTRGVYHLDDGMKVALLD